MTNALPRSPALVRDVLYEFALAKDVPDAELLDEFVRRYPEHTDTLTDFAIELIVDSLRCREPVDVAIDTTAVSPAVSRAMSKFQNALHANRTAKVTATVQGTTQAVSACYLFVRLNRQEFRQLAQDLNTNLVFVCKLRDRQIEWKTMTAGFLQFLADKLKCLPEVLVTHFAGDRPTSLQPQFYKAEKRTDGGLQQSFEDAVRSSRLTEEQQRYLLSL